MSGRLETQAGADRITSSAGPFHNDQLLCLRCQQSHLLDPSLFGPLAYFVYILCVNSRETSKFISLLASSCILLLFFFVSKRCFYYLQTDAVITMYLDTNNNHTERWEHRHTKKTNDTFQRLLKRTRFLVSSYNA